MVNAWRGEVEVIVDGVPHVAKLTLGALAELEDELQEKSLVALVERFESSQFSSRDILAVLVAGFRGGGWECDTSALLRSDIAGGPMAAAQAAAELLTRAFVVSE